MTLRMKVTGRQRVIARVSFDAEKNAVLFSYEPKPKFWRYDGCGPDDVLQQLDRATKRFAGAPMTDETRRAIACECQAVLDSLVDAGRLWVVNEDEERN